MRVVLLFIYLFIYLKILFLERRKEGEREGERSVTSHTPPTGDLAPTQARALTGNATSDLSAHRLVLNGSVGWSHTSQSCIWCFKNFLK